MTQEPVTKNLKTLLNKALETFEVSVADLEKLAPHLKTENKDSALAHLTLLLEYRLDTQDALKMLMQLHAGVLHILGLSPNLPAAINIERLKFALGHEDLNVILSLLNQLLDQLQKIIKRLKLKEEEKEQEQKLRFHREKDENVEHIKNAINKQKLALGFLDKVNKNIDILAHTKHHTGPTLNHIAALDGPISRFFQAVQNGLVVSGGLYQQAQATAKINVELNTLIKSAQRVVHQLNPPQVSRLFTPSKNVNPSEQPLEERALEKRTGNFFNQ